MKRTEHKTSYFFVDESGDPVFYNRKGRCIVGQDGCSKLLLVGFIRTSDPVPIRKKLAEIRQGIKGDEYLSQIPSLAKTLRAFHASIQRHR